MAGGNIKNAFDDLHIPETERYRVFTSRDRGYEIWKVSENVVNTFYTVPNARWDSKKWGWWVFSKKSITMHPIKDIKINNHEIIGWTNPDVDRTDFTSIADYTEAMWNRSSDRAFWDITTNLADLNDMTVEEFARYVEE